MIPNFLQSYSRQNRHKAQRQTEDQLNRRESPGRSPYKCEVRSLSRVQLLATPWTAAYQTPPSMGFSRQEYWSGVPLPFLHVWSDDFQRMLREFIDRQTVSQQTVRMQLGCCCCYVASVVSDSVRPIDGSPPGFPSLGFSSSYMQNSKVGSLSYATYKSNSTWIKDSIVRAKTVKLLEEGMEEKMTGFGNDSRL